VATSVHTHSGPSPTRGRDSSLGAYARTFGPRIALDLDGEQQLISRAAAGDPDAAGVLIRAHFPLTVRMARGYAGCGVPMEDLLGEACIGLLEAMERYSPARRVRFMTYAVWWIRCRLTRAFVGQARNVRIPRRRLVRRPGQAPPPGEVSLSEPAGSSRAPSTEDQAADPSPSAFVRVDEAERAGALRSAVTTLPPRERRIVERRFGLVGDEPASLQELAGEMGVTKERVRQLEQQAFGRLRVALGRERVPVG
jgi:RNA polymerase sigma factor (sigma-70 family)